MLNSYLSSAPGKESESKYSDKGLYLSGNYLTSILPTVRLESLGTVILGHRGSIPRSVPANNQYWAPAQKKTEQTPSTQPSPECLSIQSYFLWRAGTVPTVNTGIGKAKAIPYL